ncbi:Uncharacterised protein [Listeria grayi]|uniref:Uncharacterized protein n=1 Tax=Listeria grayi TaxID=1641 RepID=A0A378MDT6_LISGR|nr:Uncharacterised protein [Listeria grayi]
MFKRKGFYISILAIMMLVVLTACQSKNTTQSNKANKPAQVVNIMETSALPSASPTLADNSVSFRVINQIFEGLYRLDKKENHS